MAAITRIARGRGISRCEADVLAGNKPMLSVFARSGWPMTRSSASGIVHIVLDLSAGKPGEPAVGQA